MKAGIDGIGIVESLDGIDAGSWRAVPAQCDHGIHRIRRTLEHGLDGSIAAVAHPTIDAARGCLVHGPATIPDPLYPAGNDHSHPFRHLRVPGYSAVSLIKFQDSLVDGQAGACLGVDLGNHAVALGAQYVFHLHRLDHR